MFDRFMLQLIESSTLMYMKVCTALNDLFSTDKDS